MKQKYFLMLAILGLIVRLVLSVTTYHQDLGAVALSGYYIAGEGQWLNFYDNSGQDINKTIFNYQPLAYLIPAVTYSPFSSFVSKTAQNYVNADWQKNFSSSINLDLLFYKFPMIVADVLIFLFLGVILKNSKYQKHVQVIWALNPIAIFVSSVVGQVDIFIALFLLLSHLSQTKNRRYLAIAFIALSALIKPIGLILLPFIVSENKNSQKTISASFGSLFVGISIYLLGILPYLGSVSYRHYALFADQINKTVHAGIEISNGTVVPYFFIVLSFVYFLFLEKKITSLQSTILVLLASLVFTNFHPQWLVWVIPLILVQQKESWYLFLFCLLGWLLVLFSFDNTLHLGSIINSNLELPTKLVANDLFYKLTLFGRSILISCFLWLFFQGVTNKHETAT